MEMNRSVRDTMKNNSITSLQKARAIISKVGEPHQEEIINQLRGLTYNTASSKYERDAQLVIRHMEKEYALEVANVLWVEKYDEIPDFIKSYL